LLSILLAPQVVDGFILPAASIIRRKGPQAASEIDTPESDYGSANNEAPRLSWKQTLMDHVQGFLWPGSLPDETVDVPLPTGSLGCPFFGSDSMLSGNRDKGPGFFFREASEELGHPPVYKFYFLGTPVAAISGGFLHRKLSALEFSHTEALSPTYNDSPASSNVKGNDSTIGEVDMVNYDKRESQSRRRPTVFGGDNLLFERNREKHAFLRRLVGVGMTGRALEAALPTLNEIARQRIQSGLLETTAEQVNMELVCNEYTLDITQNHILGLNLPRDQLEVFRDNVKTWVRAFYSPLANMDSPWVTRFLPEYHARLYIEDQIQDKVEALLSNGPDAKASVLSDMVFAVDEDAESGVSTKTLTREQIVGNALLLIVTGSETSSGTLIFMMFLLGLHPSAYQQVVQEQRKVQAKFGNEMTMDILDHHCPYLNSVLKETMRMGPSTGGFPKRVTQTMIVEGVQIPKGWSIFSNIRLTHLLDPTTRTAEESHMNVFRGFRPERWLDEETAPSSDYIPFGTGLRHCIGSKLATLQMQLFLLQLARNVESFDLATDYRDRKVTWNPATFVPRPLDGAPLRSIQPLSLT